jgi:glycosyltransferase involved in cell wall biosynthesis
MSPSDPPNAGGTMVASDPAQRAASSLRLAYVTPAFPWVSHVFEQNEIIGLQEAGCDVVLLSCLKPPSTAPDHPFARQLQNIVHYATLPAIARGVAWCLVSRPLRTLRTAASAVWAALRQPARAAPHLGVWALAVGFAPTVARRHAEWLHADFAQGSATVAWYLHRLLDVPFSFKGHAYDIYSSAAHVREHAAFFDRKVGDAALVFAVSEFGLTQLRALTRSNLAEKARVHRIGVRLDALPLLPPAATERPHFVALGRLVEKKGFDRLIRALAVLRDRGRLATCSIHGDGPLREPLARLIAELNLQDVVTLPGGYEHDAIVDVLRPASALVVPSVVAADGDMDGVPTVIYEAMALGRPVVASALSGVPEVIRDGATGWLTPPDDPQALAETLQTVSETPAEQAAIVRRARAYVVANHGHRELSATLAEALRANLRREHSAPRGMAHERIAHAAQGETS